MDTKNKELQKFIKITLKGNLENSFTFKGKSILSLFNRIAKEEQKLFLEHIIDTISQEFEKANYETQMSEWKGSNFDELAYNQIKKKILFDVLEKLKKEKNV